MLLRNLAPGLASTGPSRSWLLSSFLLISALRALPARAGDILETNGFSTCLDSADIVVKTMNIRYDRKTSFVSLDVEGSSTTQEDVVLDLTVTAYGRQVYEKTYDPCDNNITELCPLPAGNFAANQDLTVPSSFSSMIPAIAFQIPDLDGLAQVTIRKKEGGDELACIKSAVANGETASLTSVKLATAGIAAAALAMSGVSALGAAGAGAGGGAGPSPNFGDIMGWFGFLATSGMSSVNYPTIYRSFTDNFAWSTGIIGWEQMQQSIDNFRKGTGGNLTENSIQYLMDNVTLVYTRDSSTTNSNSTKTRRGLDLYLTDIFERDITVNGTSVGGSGSSSNSSFVQTKTKVMQYVQGIQAKVESLKVPSANTFMTVLEIFCIVIAAIAVCILLFKVILEVWALFASFPKSLTGFRKRYWEFLAVTIVRIILILYGTWTLYCLYQFSHGDSWGAHILAAITLAVFTGLLGFFIWRIWTVAARAQRTEKGSEALFQEKKYVRRYGIFYDQFQSNLWWVFVPLIVYAFAKGACIALGDGHGLVQTISQAIIELMLLILLLWSRPYNTKAGNILNICISVVRVLSVVCLIIFVDELGIAQDSKTVTGLALIVIQSVLTGALAIMIVVNAIIGMVKENPHRKKRKALEKAGEADLTPLDPRDSMLTGGADGKGSYVKAADHDAYYYSESPLPLHSMTPAPQHQSMHVRNESQHNLIETASPMPIGAAVPHQQQMRQSTGYEDYRQQPIGEARAY